MLRYLKMLDSWLSKGRKDSNLTIFPHNGGAPNHIVSQFLGYSDEDRALGRSVGIYPTDAELMNNTEVVTALKQASLTEITPELVLKQYVENSIWERKQGGIHYPITPLKLSDEALEKYIYEKLKRDMRDGEPDADVSIRELARNTLDRRILQIFGRPHLDGNIEDGREARRKFLFNWWSEAFTPAPESSLSEPPQQPLRVRFAELYAALIPCRTEPMVSNVGLNGLSSFNRS